VALAVSVGSAQAAVFDFYYGNNVVATMSTSGSTTFNLNFVYAPASPNTAFINDVLMLNTGNATLANSTFTNVGPELGTAAYNASGFEGGPWNWKVSFPTSNGPGSNRFLEGELTTWKIETTTLSQWDFGSLHINAFLNGNSIKLDGCERGVSCTPTVPEPGTLALLGIGLIGLAVHRRRRS
jgi:PEP-CTERM motif